MLEPFEVATAVLTGIGGTAALLLTIWYSMS